MKNNIMEFSTQQIGKFLILTGILIALAGAVLMILGRTGLFKLPGDFVLSGKNWKIYFPVATSIVISIILTIIIWIINYFRK
jgi:uncharacterized membrane-anchored protein